MVRHEDWPRRLSDYLSESRNTKFAWGSDDCILFGAKAVEALTGQNLYAEYLGYETEQEATEILEENGGFVGIVSKHLGPGHRNYKGAQRGDLVLMKMPAYTLGLVDDSGQRIAALTDKGITRLPLNKAWRIWSY